ncbi:growth hormone-inducible transmembrane protein-like [Neocloeon triangulifer]|uniref:growth hormone-inducible transmembrane protein-like n=1 Tax=Neocloeon triangulifer TaxID=2078957 RepID=UPI00286F223D|nr:growth hormone-inducible transmembrane protein-like [Neocloeon triangulifer]
MLSTARMLCRGLSRPVSLNASKLTVVHFVAPTRAMAQEAKTNLASRLTRRGPSLKERAMGPATDSAFNMGRIAVAGGSVLGVGALCFYGLGLSNEPGAIDRAAYWPEYVKQRVHHTYMYFAGSTAIAVASAAAVMRSPRAMSLVARGTIPAMLCSVAAMIGTQILVRSIPYEPGVNMKHLAWALHAGVLGAVFAPLSFLGGAILTRAAWYTAGVVGGLSTVAMCAPSDKFLYMGGPLAAGLGVVFAASVGTWFLPPSTALGAGLYSISVYGGLLLISAFLLYDTQKIVRRAETHPAYSPVPFDPINQSIHIFIDTANIFVRIAMMLAGNPNRRK